MAELPAFLVDVALITGDCAEAVDVVFLKKRAFAAPLKSCQCLQDDYIIYIYLCVYRSILL